MTTKEAKILLDGHDDMTIASLAAGFIHRTMMHDALVRAGLATGRIASIQEMDAADHLNRMIEAAKLIEREDPDGGLDQV